MSNDKLVLPDLPWVDSCDYDDASRGCRSERPYRDVDPAPLAAFVAAAIGFRDDLLECAKVIAKDDEDGPIHLVRLIASCDLAARDVGGSLPTGTSFPEIFGSGTLGGILTATISPTVLPNLVRTLKQEGLVAATTLARQCTARERYRALDVLSHYVADPISSLRADIHDGIVVEQNPPGSGPLPSVRQENKRSRRWSGVKRLLGRYSA